MDSLAVGQLLQLQEKSTQTAEKKQSPKPTTSFSNIMKDMIEKPKSFQGTEPNEDGSSKINNSDNNLDENVDKSADKNLDENASQEVAVYGYMPMTLLQGGEIAQDTILQVAEVQPTDPIELHAIPQDIEPIGENLSTISTALDDITMQMQKVGVDEMLANTEFSDYMKTTGQGVESFGQSMEALPIETTDNQQQVVLEAGEMLIEQETINLEFLEQANALLKSKLAELLAASGTATQQAPEILTKGQLLEAVAQMMKLARQVTPEGANPEQGVIDNLAPNLATISQSEEDGVSLHYQTVLQRTAGDANAPNQDKAIQISDIKNDRSYTPEKSNTQREISFEGQIQGTSTDNVQLQNQQILEKADAITRAVTQEIIEAARMMQVGDQKTIEISLKPDFLGNMTIRLISGADGIIARIVCANDSIKEAINSQLVRLHEDLKSQGITIRAMEVTSFAESEAFQSQYQEQYQQGQQGGSQQNQPSAQNGERGITETAEPTVQPNTAATPIPHEGTLDFIA